MMEPVDAGNIEGASTESFSKENGLIYTTFSCVDERESPKTSVESSSSRSISGQPKSDYNKEDNQLTSHQLLRLSVKDGEYTYAKAEDIIMVESSDHLTIVHVARQSGKVKRTIRNSCLKDFIAELPLNYFLRVNRFCAINLKRLSGGSYHGQYFEFDHCIIVKPKRPIAHAIFNSIGK